MSDRAWAKIRIGGVAPRAALAAALEAGGYSLEDVSADANDEGQPWWDGDVLALEDADASVGAFFELESALVVAGIDFNRINDPGGEFGFGLRQFRRGWLKPMEYETTSDYEPIVSVADVRRLLADGAALAAWLDEQFPQTPALTPLEIVECPGFRDAVRTDEDD